MTGAKNAGDDDDVHELERRELLQVFPAQWVSGVMTQTDVAELVGEVPPTTVQTIGVIGAGWSAPEAARLIRHTAVGLGIPARLRELPGHWVLAVHAAERPGRVPLGLIAFKPTIVYVPDASNRTLHFELDLPVAWLNPVLAKRELELHLAAHVIRYLAAHPLPHDQFSNILTGLQVELSIGGASAVPPKVKTAIVKCFELWEEEQDAAGDQMLTWPVRSVDLQGPAD